MTLVQQAPSVRKVLKGIRVTLAHKVLKGIRVTLAHKDPKGIRVTLDFKVPSAPLELHSTSSAHMLLSQT